MSISKSVGRCTLFALVVYLFIKGALIVVPRNMVAALSALVAAMVHACCGTEGSTSLHHESAPAVLLAAAPPFTTWVARWLTGKARSIPKEP